MTDDPSLMQIGTRHSLLHKFATSRSFTPPSGPIFLTLEEVVERYRGRVIEMLRPCRRGSDISFLRGGALDNSTNHHVDPREYIISVLKRRRSQTRIPIPRAPSPPASTGV
jgi:hypothetical protein